MASAADRLNINAQLEHLQSKHVGTGHPDTTRHEWASAMKRDTYASLVGHHSLAVYSAVAENESVGRMKYEFKQRMMLPVGLPPEEAKDDDGDK